MTFLPRPRFAVLAMGCVLAALSLSCDVQPHVQSTIPENQSTNVSSRSIVAVRLSNSVTDKDTKALDPQNLVVTGDLTQGAYAGKLVLARHDKLRKRMTVEEFQQSQTAAAVDANPGAADTKSKTTTVLNDAIVFLLPQGTSFKEGETIHVAVNPKITSHGSPLSRRKSFFFHVGSSAGASGELRVTGTDPIAGENQVSARRRIAATFNRAVKGDGLAGAITVRGAQSGVHTGGDTVFSRTSGSNQVLEVVRRLAATDSFVPGETVNVTWSSAITDTGTAGQAAPAKLTPYNLEYQVEAGLNQGGWAVSLDDPPAAGGTPVAILAADFLPAVEGVEIAVVGNGNVSLYSQATGPRIWTRTDTPIPLGDGTVTFSVADGAVYDTNDDGNPEVVVLLTNARGSRLIVFEVKDSVGFAVTGKPANFPVVQPGKMTLSDVDANGKPEIIISHPSTSYVPAAGSPAKKTGTVTFLELKLVPPDPADVNPADPASLTPKPGFVPTHDAIQGFTRARRIELSDLNNDGKLDLIAEIDSGIQLFRNIGNATQQFAFRSVSKLQSSKLAVPLAWVVADADADGDQDIIVWDTEGTFLFRNQFLSNDAAAEQPSQARGLLAEDVIPESLSGLPVLSKPAQVRALELNGDAILDLVLLESGGGVTLLLGNESPPLSFKTVQQSGPASPAGLAVADFDGDSGLDVGVVSSSGGAMRVFLSEGVTAPTVASPSSFQFAPDGGGLTDLSGNKIHLAVLGNFKEKFGGYSIALEYDESLLTYTGFEIPAVLGRKASFTSCPDDNLQGCFGNASARMAYLRNGQGLPEDGVLLGTFNFKLKDVTATKTTRIELKSFPGPSNTTFSNSLNVVDGTATVSTPVQIEGDPIDLVLHPPAPQALAAQCTVLSRDDASLAGRITWSSPAGALFTEYQITVGGGAPTTLPGTASFFEFTTVLTGPINVTVSTKDILDQPVSASCQIIGIHRPSVTCVAVDIGKQNHVGWSLSHPVDRFVIYRNGVRLTQTDTGSDTEYVDNSPSRNGADNYEVAGVLGGVQGPRGSCAGGPIGDPDTNTTLPPIITEAALLARQTPADPNVLRCRWANGEGYTSISLTLEKVGEATPIVSETLSGTTTEFPFPGDAARGGVKPGQYVFTVTGKAGSKSSETKRSSQISVAVPVLAVTLTCTVAGSGDIQAVWQPVWPGYTSLKLIIEQRIDGNLQDSPEEIPLDFVTTTHTVSGHAPVGVYTLRLKASYTDALPPALQPRPENLQVSCEESFSPRIHVGREKGGVGMSGVEIPIKADFFGVVKGFHFELEYPAFFNVDKATGLRVVFPGAVTEEFSIKAGSTTLTKKAIVTISGVEILPDADGKTVLATIVGSLPLDFTLPPESPLFFTGLASLKFGAVGNTVVDSSDEGALLVKRRFVRLDTGSVAAGSSEAVTLNVHSTFNAPPSAPKYRLNAFQIHLTWDPSLVDLLPVTDVDQKQTALFDTQKNKILGSFFLPNDATLASGNETGDLQVSWLGFDFTNPTEPVFLYPGVDLKLLVTRFRSKVPGNSPAVFASINFVQAPRPGKDHDLATAFFPEVDVPSEPDLDGFFGGGLDITSTAAPFTLTSITPVQGTLCGGDTVTLKGEGFLTSLTVQFGSLVARSVEIVDAKTARAVTPSALEGTTVVTVTIANGTAPGVTKPNAFTFQQLAPAFFRGDVDQNGKIDFVDATTLSDLLLGKSRSFPANRDAADANDDGLVNGGDVTTILNHLFGGLSTLPAPFGSRGLDPTPDKITSCGQ